MAGSAGGDNLMLPYFVTAPLSHSEDGSLSGTSEIRNGFANGDDSSGIAFAFKGAVFAWACCAIISSPCGDLREMGVTGADTWLGGNVV